MMKKSHVLIAGLFTLLLFLVLFVEQAEAVPAFARQTGMTCNTCHQGSYPALNSFGRNFRAGGYVMKGSQHNIEGNGLSLPATINASIITKIRYELPGDVDGNRGEIQWPDEAAILVGGRAAENVGFLMELGLASQEVDGDKTGGAFLSTKFHFNVAENIAIIPFSTDGLGVGYGFELLNTGAQRSQRPIENRKGMSAGQMLGTASGTATGIAFVYSTPDFFVNYSHWAPTWGNVNANILGGLAHYIRAAYTPNLGGWDTGLGVAMMTGSVDVGANDPAETVNVDGWTIDAQAQGNFMDMPLGLYGSYGFVPKSTDDKANFYNGSTENDASGFGFLAKLDVLSNTSAYVAYASKDAGDKVTNITLGGQYMVAQNIKLELFHVMSDTDNKGDDYTMLMLFAGF
jgi:hypothetical protein